MQYISGRREYIHIYIRNLFKNYSIRSKLLLILTFLDIHFVTHLKIYIYV
jgi:hypothetical protein